MNPKATPLLECIPNFSEGRDKNVIDEIVHHISSVHGIEILHIDMGYSVNRTVVTFLGQPSAVVEAAFRGIKTAASLIDMRLQKGTHPRIGSTDVCPLVPFRNVSKEEAVMWSNKLGKRVGEELQIPVYLYEWSAKKDYRKLLSAIRKGGYEKMSSKINNEEWLPDFGPNLFPLNTGATVIGARFFLIAYNIQLASQNLEVALKIAHKLREKKTLNHCEKKAPGLKGVRAIGWFIPEYKEVQVSFNITDYRVTSIFEVYEACREAAEEWGVEISGSEMIGMVPMEALKNAGEQIIQVGKANTYSKPVEAAIAYLGLSKIHSFNPNERIISLKSTL